MNELLATRLDKTELEPITSKVPKNVAGIAMELSALSMQFARIERIPRYEDSRRESDAEHSFMLAVVAPELAELLDIGLDVALVHQYSTGHDLIELKTGDVSTYSADPALLAAKEKAEQAALQELLLELPPYNRRIVAAYEMQADRESRFVRAVDKLLPLIVDILGDGDRVMREDCGVTTHEDLVAGHEKLYASMDRRFGEFPELVEAHGLLCELYDLESTILSALEY